MYNKIILSVILCISLVSAMFAQGELITTVRVATPQLQQADRKIFDDMEVQLRDFLNTTKWTNDSYEPAERIECNFIITISEELGGNAYKGELAVQSTRPVFGSGYKTALLSHLDKDVTFTYEQNQSIDFVLDGVQNQNLPALLAFYAYIIIGLDYDSYSLNGGDQYFLNAMQVVTNIQNSATNKSTGWRPGDGGKNRNRYWLIENILNPRVKPYRTAMYTYYRKGLDNFMNNMDLGKVSIMQALEEVDKVNTTYFNSMIIQMFSNAKRDELIEMWKLGGKPQKDRVIQIMSKIDPANGSKYREIGS